ncbi:hypothetical protein AnigIFM56816_008535 [Aspergillus niger]|nr:hypothetical protein AnigIFM49718_011404 [Aspergillus niger]GKZ83442.1 hypothetical protein AnigIFM56816_008535 [Aspergillus niger]
MDYAFGEGSESSLLPSKSHGSIPNQNSAARYIIGGITVVALILAGSLLGRTSTRTPADNSCQAPSYRQEWRMLSLEERQAYITAVQCLTTKPSRMEHNGTTRYDDFVYSHLAVSAETHGTPISFPWHRIYIQKYEDALRLECGYQGNLPYWDWTLDASTNPLHSPIWSHEFGLGGNGSHPANCVEDGPFAAIKPQYPEPHCLQRKFSDENMYGREYTASIVNAIVTESNSYGEFRERLEAGPHRFIHLAIGGDMPELWSSNGTLRTTSPLLH